MTAVHGAGSAIGYLYQTSWALLHLLRRGPDVPDVSVSVEMHVDVAWNIDGTPTERLRSSQLARWRSAGLGRMDPLVMGKASGFRARCNLGRPISRGVQAGLPRMRRGCR